MDGPRWIVAVAVAAAFAAPAAEAAFPTLKGPYLGQAPPGRTPVVFAPGILSGPNNEVSTAFMPGARELYFATFNRGVGYTIMVMKEESDGWSEPRVATGSSSSSPAAGSVHTTFSGWMPGSSRNIRQTTRSEDRG